MEGRVIAKNKKAYFDYEVLEKYEAGVVLKGSEVKSIKAGGVQLKGSYVSPTFDRDGHIRIITNNLHVSPYAQAGEKNSDPMRQRELLLSKKEMEHLALKANHEGFTLIPLEIYLKKGLIKILLGVCRGKKVHDKRIGLKKRAVIKEINIGLKKFSR